MLKIIKATEPIEVEHPVFLIVGQPGICKSSLGYSAKDPLTLDFDAGAHRAANRRDTLVISHWKDVEELMQSRDELGPYSTITVDTVGRCLDCMTGAMADPKHIRAGTLTLQGWGVLKSQFRTWVSQLRALGKDVLLLAHDKEEKDGDSVTVRADIAGGSYQEVMKIADFVGYLYMKGNDRMLDFSPTDRWVGKNPAGWRPFVVPPVAKATSFMAELMEKGREALGAISEESAAIAGMVDAWRKTVAACETPETLTAAIAKTNSLAPIILPQAKKIILDRGKALGFVWNPGEKAFKAAAHAAAVA